MKSYLDLGNFLFYVSISIGLDENVLEEIVVKMNDKEIFMKDLGYKFECGIYFMGCMDDVINVLGLKVFFIEVEEMMF